MNPSIVAPLVGPVTRGAWTTHDLVGGPVLPSGKPLRYNDTTSQTNWDLAFWQHSAGSAPTVSGPSGAQAGTSKFRLLFDPKLGHDVWDTYHPLPAGRPLYDWMWAQRSTGVIVVDPIPFTPSPDLTTVKAGSSEVITDKAGNKWTITASAQIAVNGAVDATTANVALIAVVKTVIWQKNVGLDWYSKTAPSAAWVGPSRVDPTVPVVVGKGFKVRDGKIYDPQGALYFAQGMNNRPDDPSTAAAILKLFPGITYVRLAMGSLVDPAKWVDFITTMEAKKVVCMAEYHPWPMVNAQSGAALAAEAAWAGSWAKYYKDRPYVWVGSMNEPQGGTMTPEHVAVYNAVRAADPAKVVMLMCGIGGGNPGAVGTASLTASAYAQMTNIVWDLHSYGWSSQFSTDQNAVTAKLTGSVSAHTGILGAQEIKSADGMVPVIVAEFGPSTTGSKLDANADQVIKAVISAKSSGYAGWAWAADPFNALQKTGALTDWGKTLAKAIASGVVQPPVDPPVDPPAGPTHLTVAAKIDDAVETLGEAKADVAGLKP